MFAPILVLSSFAETGRDREAVALLLVSAAIAFGALWPSTRLTSRNGTRA